MLTNENKFTGSERYQLVEVDYKDSKVYAVELLKIPFCGIMVVYGKVSLTALEEQDKAVLSFDYEIIKHVPGKWTTAELEDYLGGVLEEILEKQAQKGELVFTGGTDGEDRENRIIKLDTQRGLL